MTPCEPRIVKRFNPLPSPKQGEIPRSRYIPTRLARFNPLPSPKQGEIH